MTSMLSSSNLLVFTAAATALYLIRWKRSMRDLPPGPTKLPLIGSVLSMPARMDSKFFEEMSKEYGSDILHLSVFSENIIILNSYEAAEELLGKRSGIFSSRPPLLTMDDLAGVSFRWAMWPYGDAWRNARRSFTHHFDRPQIYQPRETRYCHRLLQQLLKEPSKWYSSIQLLTSSTSLDMTYGVKINSADDELVKIAESSARLIARLVGSGLFLVDIFPFLRFIPAWFPGAWFQRLAAEMRPAAARVLDEPFEASVRSMKDGNYKSSYVTAVLDDVQGKITSKEDADFVKKVAAQVFLAGSDTSRAALVNFVSAMVQYPDVQKKAQRELDSVLNGRLPEHQDLQNLPYLSAVILETLRWQPVIPLGVIHVNIAVDTYAGYRIPTGSRISPNQAAFLRNPKDYPGPEKFNPERFLKDGKLNPEVRNPLGIAFGFGRRICPGRHIAQSTIMLAASSILSTFDIVKCHDESGNVIEPNVQYRRASLDQPQEFPCDFKPRSQHSIDVISSLTDDL